MRALLPTFARIALAPAVVHAGFQQFTIEFKGKAKPGGELEARKVVVSMDGDRMRYEVETTAGDHLVSIYRKQGGQVVGLMLRPERKHYVRVPMEGTSIQRILDLAPGDDFPCAPEARCTRIGRDRILGYEVTGWRESGPDGTVTLWYSPALGYALRTDSEGEVLEAVRVIDKAPPAERFEIPAGWTEYDPMRSAPGGWGMPGASASPTEAPAPPDAGDPGGFVEEVADDAIDTAKQEARQGIRDAIRGLFGR